MIKYFTYNISNFKGYRLKVEESNIKFFSKLIYNGLNIVRSSTAFIHYEIDLKLIRNLKLRKLNDLIRPNSVEDRILQLMERSIEVEKDIIYPSYSSGSYFSYYDEYHSSSYSYSDYSDVEYNKSQNKNREKYQSKIHSQMAKQYGICR